MKERTSYGYHAVEDREAWHAGFQANAATGGKELDTTERLNNNMQRSEDGV